MIAPDTPTPDARTILVAEDNHFDQVILQQIFDEVGIDARLKFVSNGEEVMDYLHRRAAFSDPNATPRPSLVLLDLNMPRMNGQETLDAIRSDVVLRALPVIILSTSDNQKQIATAYANGVNSFLTKPAPYDDFVEMIRNFGAYWLHCAKLPALSLYTS